MKTLQFGETTVSRCVDPRDEFSRDLSFLTVIRTPSKPNVATGSPHFVDADSGRLLMSLHSYIIKTLQHTIVVDTCVGNHKHRPDTKPWHMKDGPFLEDMAAMGVTPESVDFVMCTHLHVDHVGWN